MCIVVQTLRCHTTTVKYYSAHQCTCLLLPSATKEVSFLELVQTLFQSETQRPQTTFGELQIAPGLENLLFKFTWRMTRSVLNPVQQTAIVTRECSTSSLLPAINQLSAPCYQPSAATTRCELSISYQLPTPAIRSATSISHLLLTTTAISSHCETVSTAPLRAMRHSC